MLYETVILSEQLFEVLQPIAMAGLKELRVRVPKLKQLLFELRMPMRGLWISVGQHMQVLPNLSVCMMCQGRSADFQICRLNVMELEPLQVCCSSSLAYEMYSNAFVGVQEIQSRLKV